MRRLGERFPDTLAIIGVHSAKFPAERLSANLRAAVLRHGITHPVVNDADFAVWHQYAVRAWPTLVLIDPRGRVVASQSGEVTAEELAPEIERLVAEAEAAGVLDRAPLDVAGEVAGEPERPLAFPSKLLATADGRLYIADTGHHRVLELRLAKDGRSAELRRVFGTGRPGLADGPAEAAAFHGPHGLALAGDRLYVADTENHAVRAVNLNTGWVRTLAGTGEKAHGSFALGAPTDTPLRSPWAVLAVEDFVFIAMAGSHQVWVLVEESQIGPFAGNGREALVDGPREQASFNQPSDLAYGLGHLFVADAEASAVRAVTLGEMPRVFTLVGMGLFEFGDRDGRGNQVRLQHPTGLAFGDGLLYVADSYNHKVKTLDPTTGEAKTLIGTGQAGRADGLFSRATLYEPEGLALAGRRLYIADTNNHVVRVADLDSRLLRTLELRGLDRPRPVAAPPVPAPVTELPARVVAPGRVSLAITVTLPAGQKLNDAAASTVRLLPDGPEAPLGADGRAALNLDVAGAREALLEVAVYHCADGAEDLCFVHVARLALPLETGPHADVVAAVAYAVPAPGDMGA